MTESYLVADGKHSKQQYNFIKNEIWILSWAAASQRANIFPKNTLGEVSISRNLLPAANFFSHKSAPSNAEKAVR